MLLELSISDFAIIERTTIRFSEGLNALTGETGAGKSVLLDALGAVLGARVSSDLVRTGASQARVEAAFTLERMRDLGIVEEMAALGINPGEDDLVILAREIGANGRSTARINGRLANASTLARIGASLVDIHGQSDHLAILRPVEQRNLLDRFGQLEDRRTALAAAVREWRSIRNRIQELQHGAREREQRLDLLRFQIDEIDTAAITPGEDEALAGEREVLRNADRLRADALDALALLTDDDVTEATAAVAMIRTVVSRTADIASLDTNAGGLEERAGEILVLAEDLARDLRDYGESVESNDLRLAEVEDRIAEIQGLKRKYGATIEEILAFGESAHAELAEMSSAAHDVPALEERLASLERDVAERAWSLSETRSLAATVLAGAIEQSVAELNLGRAQIRIDVTQQPDPAGIAVDQDGTNAVRIDETGIDDVEFLIAPNAGEALKPLARIASGGETARLMLATKSILSEVDRTPTLVFDEIDVGVGGRSGQVVGEKLWGIAGKHQVIVVSHLPQVAAFAETHLRIEKHASGNRTASEVRLLDGHDRVLELAAMLDGLPVTEAARRNAESMLQRSQGFISAASGS